MFQNRKLNLVLNVIGSLKHVQTPKSIIAGNEIRQPGKLITEIDH